MHRRLSLSSPRELRQERARRCGFAELIVGHPAGELRVGWGDELRVGWGDELRVGWGERSN